MEAFYIYFLKSSGIILIFLACYKLFLSRETFHTGNRYFLLSGLALALILPLMSYTKIVWIALPTFDVQQAETILPPTLSEVTPVIEFTSILFVVYLLGIFYGMFRLLVQFLSLRRIIENGKILQKDKFTVLESSKPLQPFSFFNYIIYHSESHSEEDLKAILTHEKIHSSQYHSVDIIVMHFFSIFQWCNPFVHLYKFYLKENLEFIADTQSISTEIQKENYQYLLVKRSLNEKHLDFVNPFFNSSIKKRIVMLNKKKSKKSSSVKYALVAPLLVGFFLLFNVETVAKIKRENESRFNAEQDPQLIDPKIYSISKETSDEEIESLKRKIKKEKGELSIKNLKRNSKGTIITISITYKKVSGHVTGNYNKENNINKIYFGQNEKGGLFVSTDESKLSDLKKGILPKIKKQVYSRNDSDQTKNSNSTNRLNQSKNNKFNEVTYDKDKSGDFNHLSAFNYRYSGTYQPYPSPTYYVNGVEMPSKQVSSTSPNNIESVHVYKGEYAVWHYGEKGENGVVSILTKDAQPSQNLDADAFIAAYGVKDTLEKPKVLIHNENLPLIIVNGKKMSKIEFDKLSKNQIESMSFLKLKAAKKKYGKKAENGVVEISLKKKNAKIKDTNAIIIGQKKSQLILIDGKESSKEEIKSLDQDKVKSIAILKDESAEEKYGKKGENGVIEITLKNKEEQVKEVKKFDERNTSVLQMIENSKSDESKFEPDLEKVFITINGVESKKEALKNINIDELISIFIFVPEIAIKKYGEKAKKGAVVLIIKKE